MVERLGYFMGLEFPMEIVAELQTTEFQGQLESYLRDIIEQLREDYPEEFSILTAVLAGDTRALKRIWKRGTRAY